mmetsp:Transcript_5652/g.13042  ORF Transcript_5652/g.13042 Transcript_5652/m.13042 type:complete len:145 (-) Transcript_5652:444-878(-)
MLDAVVCVSIIYTIDTVVLACFACKPAHLEQYLPQTAGASSRVVRSFVRSLFSEQKILRWAYRSCAPWSANRKPKTEKGPIHPSIHPSVPPSPSSFDPSLSRLSILRWVLPPRRRKDDLGGRRKDNAMRNTTARDILPTRQYSS